MITEIVLSRFLKMEPLIMSEVTWSII